VPASSSCTACPGQFSAAGASTCTPCPAGTWYLSTLTSGYATSACGGQCQAGTFSPAGGFSYTGAGLAGSVQSCTTCTACASTQTLVTQCPNTANTAVCKCNSGYSQSSASAGSGSCSACGTGTYSTTTGSAGQSSCTACPANSNGSPGGAGISSCVCKFGFWSGTGTATLNGNAQVDCTPWSSTCPEGTYYSAAASTTQDQVCTTCFGTNFYSASADRKSVV
jgi:syndecan 4